MLIFEFYFLYESLSIFGSSLSFKVLSLSLKFEFCILYL